MGALKEGDPKHFNILLSFQLSCRLKSGPGQERFPTESDLAIVVGLSNFNDFQCRLHDD